MQKLKKLSPNEKWEIHDWESLLSDPEDYTQFRAALQEVIIDPIAFQFNLARIPKEDTGEIINLWPYNFQIDYVQDPARSKILLKSRQVGFTTEEAFYRYWRGYTINGYNCCFVHLREENATKYIKIIGQLNDNIVPHLRMKFRRDTVTLKEAINGSSWRTFSSNSVHAIRGFTGDVIFDEFAIASHAEELLAGGGSAAVRGSLQRCIGSTPKGCNNAFHRLCDESSWDTGRTFGSVAKYKEIEIECMKLFKEGYFEAKDKQTMRQMMFDYVDKKVEPIKIKDARDFYREFDRVKRNNFSMYSIHVAPWYICDGLKWSDIMQIGLSYGSLLQEYFLSFSESEMYMLSEAELDACIVEDMSLYNPYQFTPSASRRVYMGCDPSLGKVNETAWFFIAEPIFNENGMLLEPWRVLHYESTFDPPKQKSGPQYESRLLNQIRIFRPTKCYFDSTTIGDTVVDDLIIAGLEESITERVSMRGKVHEETFYNLIHIIQNQLIMLPPDTRLKDQLFSLEKTYTDSGKPHFSGKCNSSDGQDDMAVALALAVSIGSARYRSRYKSAEINIPDMKYEDDKHYRRGKNEFYF